jgi:hypothetical protein
MRGMHAAQACEHVPQGRDLVGFHIVVMIEMAYYIFMKLFSVSRSY